MTRDQSRDDDLDLALSELRRADRWRLRKRNRKAIAMLEYIRQHPDPRRPE